MNTTPHFIAVRAWSRHLRDLLEALREKIPEGMAEFQDIDSAHVTLGYLPAEVSGITGRLADFVRTSQALSPSLRIAGFGYFGEPDTPRVGYLSPLDDEFFQGEHERFRREFPEYASFAENAYRPYLPHLTLFRVLDTGGFASMRALVDTTLSGWCTRTGGEDISHGVALFSADSTVRPERQTVVLSSD